MEQILDILQRLQNEFIITFLVFFGTFLFINAMPKRKYYILRLIAGFSIILIFYYLWNVIFSQDSFANYGILKSLRYLGIYLLTLLTLFLSYDCKFIEAMFCTTCGYCLQQIFSRFYGCVSIIIGNYGQMNLLFNVFIGLIVYIFVIKKNYRLKPNLEINSPLQLILSSFVLLVVIFIEQSFYPYLKNIDNKLVRLGEYFSSMMFALITFILELNLLSRRKTEHELSIIKLIMEEQSKQFELEKNIVEKLNIICHDAKFQMNKDICDERSKEVIDIYDSIFKTGNKGLDIVLTMKNEFCKKNNIELTSMIKGDELLFMSETETYSLFGNILENAIEAVMCLENKNKRVISISSYHANNKLIIHEENYYSGTLEMKEGLPQTSKSDFENHGFGTKSIKMIVEQYGGQVLFSHNNDIFNIDIIFDQDVIKTN